MKTRILKLSCLALLLFTFFGCNDCSECEEKVKKTEEKLKVSEEKLKAHLAKSKIQTSDVIYFNVLLDESNNDEFQLIHIEGKYDLPYIILGKFKVKDVGKKCTLESITFKIKSIDGRNYKFANTPTYSYDTNEGKFKSLIEVELASSSSRSNDVTLSRINREIEDKKILDVKVKNSTKLGQILQKKYGAEDDDKHWTIKCCGGAICKVKFDTGG
ncbi:hypothetical protein [Psychroserpens luteolus]|uniref:hypothetical protein n=1 Tax=Psychroserpens luteolus TaxID=2855840 RepID=UPI001E457FC1|nr:hypothetical protein [Psychroserpens luteolus]MCD2260432.1 hypothetical protein [Psychroserpens luteolus]